MRPNRWQLIDRAEPFGAKNLPGNKITMTNFRLALLATTALTAMQFASVPSWAQPDSIVVAQAQPADSDKKPPAKGPPPAAAPARPAPPPAAPPPAAATAAPVAFVRPPAPAAPP
ncbi:MAG TPA: hypothetical protein VNJ49_19885, partial [Bradyrhizobium sp.]|nr:hypothetical protein [Bradyrhizobium sp.]